jgi:hypothetical protein
MQKANCFQHKSLFNAFRLVIDVVQKIRSFDLFEDTRKCFAELSFLSSLDLNTIKLVNLIPWTAFYRAIKVCNCNTQWFEVFTELQKGIHNRHCHFHINEFRPIELFKFFTVYCFDR